MKFYIHSACKENPFIPDQIPNAASAKFWRDPHLKRKVIMRINLCILVIIAGLMQVSAATYAQKITLNEKNANLEDVFDKIRLQSGYNIVYSEDLLAKTTPVTIYLKDATVEHALQVALTNQPLTYEIDDKTIVITARQESFLDNLKDKATKLMALPSDITGTVTDSLGDPLVGATVFLKQSKETRLNSLTDLKGNFKFTNVPQGNYAIEVSYIGYDKLRREIINDGKLANVHLIMHPASSKLDEVQVIAYGETTQRYEVGSISKVTAADIAEQPVANPLEALEGRVPGLVITESSGFPGASIQVQVRGQNTLISNPNSTALNFPDNPLFIIDGVPFAPQNININQMNSLAAPDIYETINGMSPFNSISPDDIENIEVLRDADATAIYGSRGSNGVVLITTKKGKVGPIKLNASVSSGDNYITRIMPLMNTQQYLQMRYDAFANDGQIPTSRSADLLLFDTTRNVNWEKYLWGETAHSTDANASLSGGNENTQFLVGTSYHYQSYAVPGDFGDNRASFNVNFHHNSNNKRLKIDFSANYSYDTNNSSTDYSDAKLVFELPPDAPNFLNPNGSLVWNYKGIDMKNLYGNPLAYLKEIYNLQSYNLISHFQIEYQIISGLNIRSSFGYNTFNSDEYSEVPSTAIDPSRHNHSGSANFGTNDFGTWNIEPQIEYKKIISKGKLDILLGSTFEQDSNSSTLINGSEYTNDALLGSISAAGAVTASDNYTLYKYNAVFGRVNYIWNSKYIIDINGRRDGSSRFGPGKQFGNFGSIGTGWIFSEEPFVKKFIPSMSYGKFHISYGTTGNDNVGNYQYLANYQPSSGISYQGITGYQPQNLFNPDYAWAVTKKLEGGIDIGFLQDRILFNATYFVDRCSNQLITYALPIQTGFSGVTENLPATVQNTGLELQLTTKNIKSSSFQWSTSFNLTAPSNKLIAFPGLATSPYADYYIIGQSTRVIQGFRLLGVNPTTGVYQFLTASGQPTYNPTYRDGTSPGDEVTLGNTDPKFFGGLRNTFNYKGFQLDVFLQYTKQMGLNYLAQIYQSGNVGGPTNEPVAVLSNWRKPGDISSIEQFTENSSSNAANAEQYFTSSSGAYSDASFIRVKTLSFSYTLKNAYLKKIGASSCSIYLNAQNLFTITDYKGNDPETQNYYALPPLKTVVAGLKFTY